MFFTKFRITTASNDEGIFYEKYFCTIDVTN